MMQIRITLLSDLCAGSGESFGNRVDTDMVTDEFGLPVIPARRIKGCLRQSAELLCDHKYVLPSVNHLFDQQLLDRLFGTPQESGAVTISTGILPNYQSLVYTIKQARKQRLLSAAASPAAITDLFSRVLGQTMLQNGVAHDNTLRYTRVLNASSPFDTNKQNLFISQVSVSDSDPVLVAALDACCKATRHMGTHRNRGLGQVRVELDNQVNDSSKSSFAVRPPAGEDITLEYHVALDANLVIQGLDSHLSMVPARSVIGAMAQTWLTKHRQADTVFDDLFQNGKVQWSALTPVISGQRSNPAPAMLVKIKQTGVYRNSFVLSDEELKMKKSPLSGMFAVNVQGSCMVASPDTVAAYHHRHKSDEHEAILYKQSALNANMMYAGTVTLPSDLLDSILELFSNVRFRIGHSRNAQYAACSIKKVVDCTAQQHATVKTTPGDIVCVSLASDVVLTKDGVYTATPDDIREAIAASLGLCPDETEYRDLYTDCYLSGFQNMWGLWKPVVPAAQAGSVFCFKATGNELPAQFRIGEFKQEGLGVCRVDLLKECCSSVTHTQVDRVDLSGESVSSDMYSLLLTGAAKSAIRQSASEVYMKNRDIWVDSKYDGFFSRVRLMIRESSSPEDLYHRINDVKDESKKNLGSQFFREVLEGVEPRVYIKAMLRSDLAVADAVVADAKARECVAAMWKTMVMQVIHDLYHAKSSANKGGAEQ